jgi:hypothetical protein
MMKNEEKFFIFLEFKTWKLRTKNLLMYESILFLKTLKQNILKIFLFFS